MSFIGSSDSIHSRRNLTTHDIKGIIRERQASGGAIKGLIFCVAKVSADVTFWSGDSCRCAEFFARPADSAGPFFAHCFTIYRGCLREFLRVRAAAETLFAGVVVAAAACTHSARNADVYVPGKVHGLLSALFVSTAWRHDERNSAFFHPQAQSIALSRAAAAWAEMSQFVWKLEFTLPQQRRLLFPYPLLLSLTVRVTDFYEFTRDTF